MTLQSGTALSDAAVVDVGSLDPDSSSSSEKEEGADEYYHPENLPGDGGFESDHTICGVGWRKKQVKLDSVANSKPVVIQLRNGYSVFLYQLDMSIKTSSSRLYKKTKRSNVGMHVKQYKIGLSSLLFSKTLALLRLLTVIALLFVLVYW